jgi:hypothetical protein
MNSGITQGLPWTSAGCGMSEFKMQFGAIANFPSYSGPHEKRPTKAELDEFVRFLKGSL